MLNKCFYQSLKRFHYQHFIEINPFFQFSTNCFQDTKIKMMPSYTGSNNELVNSKFPVIDLRSDTVSKPSLEMRQAMFDAVVGDDVYQDDPTVKKLEQMAAEMMQKEAALFAASGTMGNLISIMAHCNTRGCEIICGDQSHTFLYEQGGPAQIAGVHTCTIPNNPDGTFDIDLVESSIRGNDVHRASTGLIIVENTHNMCGGKVLPIAWINKLADLASKYNIPLHMDGARVFNASVYLNLPVSNIVERFDSVQFCLSKSLGCPVGSLIVGTKEFIEKGRRLRKVLGGGMRQVGVLAAPGIVALTSMVDRLAEDHRRTKEIALGIKNLNSKYVKVDVAGLHTNILMIYLDSNYISAPQFCSRLVEVTEDEERSEVNDDVCQVRVSPKTNSIVRLVVYYEITDQHVQQIIKKITYIVKELELKINQKIEI